MDGIRRGQIYLADLDPVIGSEQGGVRPVLVVQNDRGSGCTRTVIVAPLAGRARRWVPTCVALPASGAETNREMTKVDMAIRVSLGLDSSSDVITLCGMCSRQFREAGCHLSARALESTMDSPCSYCGSRVGRDYVIVGP